MQLEICCFNIGSALVAQQYGASRIELCDNPAEGGTTPSYGYLERAREILRIPLFPIVRARGGDFLYNDDEYRIMLKDIQQIKQLGCDGIVIGLLAADGNINKSRTARLVQLAYPMSVTFHRAFDRVQDPFQALEDIIDTGCERILTSGLRPTVDEGVELITQLVRAAADRIIIMPGSGVRAGNISQLARATGASEFHSSARISVPSKMNYVNPGMNESLDQVMCDGAEVGKMAEALSTLNLICLFLKDSNNFRI
jgi:copper homeostasis protein